MEPSDRDRLLWVTGRNLQDLSQNPLEMWQPKVPKIANMEHHGKSWNHINSELTALLDSLWTGPSLALLGDVVAVLWEDRKAQRNDAPRAEIHEVQLRILQRSPSGRYDTTFFQNAAAVEMVPLWSGQFTKDNANGIAVEHGSGLQQQHGEMVVILDFFQPK